MEFVVGTISLSCELCSLSKAAFVHVRPEQLCTEAGTIVYGLSCTRLRILLNTIYRKPGFNSLRTPHNHGAEQASNETLKQTQQRNWSNASQGGQTALKEHVAVLHYERDHFQSWKESKLCFVQQCHKNGCLILSILCVENAKLRFIDFDDTIDEFTAREARRKIFWQ